MSFVVNSDRRRIIARIINSMSVSSSSSSIAYSLSRLFVRNAILSSNDDITGAVVFVPGAPWQGEEKKQKTKKEEWKNQLDNDTVVFEGTISDYPDCYSISRDGSSTVITTATTMSRRQQRKNNKKRRRNKNNKSQHSLDYMKQHVSELMSIFETNGWFIPMPVDNKDGISYGYDDDKNINTNSNTNNNDGNTTNSNIQRKHQRNKSKVWSNRNYGADKKRQRKQNERLLFQSRILQLETLLYQKYNIMYNAKI